MTSILGLATGTVHQTQELHRLPPPEVLITREAENVPELAYMESLLRLDAPEWVQFLKEHQAY